MLSIQWLGGSLFSTHFSFSELTTLHCLCEAGHSLKLHIHLLFTQQFTGGTLTFQHFQKSLANLPKHGDLLLGLTTKCPVLKSLWGHWHSASRLPNSGCSKKRSGMTLAPCVLLVDWCPVTLMTSLVIGQP